MISAQDFAETLELEVLVPSTVKAWDLKTTDLNRPGLQFTGYFDYFAYERPQVIGKTEMAYLASLEKVAALPVKRVFPAHHSLDMEPEILVRMRDTLRALKAEGRLRHGEGVVDCGDWAIWL